MAQLLHSKISSTTVDLALCCLHTPRRQPLAVSLFLYTRDNINLQPRAVPMWLSSKCVEFYVNQRLTISRYKASLSIPRWIRQIDFYRAVHLWSVSRFPKGQLHLQNEAKFAVSTTLRHRIYLDRCDRAQEATPRDNQGCICYRQDWQSSCLATGWSRCNCGGCPATRYINA